MFDFAMTPAQKQLREDARTFVKKEIIPIAEEYDRRGETPLHVCQKFYQAGWLSRFICDYDQDKNKFLTDFFIATEEMSYGCVGISSLIMFPLFLNRIVLDALTGDAREEFKNKLLKEQFLTSFSATEHEAGSDLLTLKTTARRVDGGYVINGKKAFSSNIRHARYVILVARTGADGARSPDAFSLFLVPTDSPGFVVGARWKTLGLRSMDLSALEFHDVFIPERNRLSPEGQGLTLMAQHLNLSRTGIGAMGVGIARRARDEVLEYGRSRKLYGDRLIKLQDYRFRIVEMEQDIAAARALVWLSCLKHEQGLEHTKEASLAKLYSGQMVMRVTDAASKMMGSIGYTETAVVEKLLRDARHVAIVEGPEPVQKEVIFGQMLRRNLV